MFDTPIFGTHDILVSMTCTLAQHRPHTKSITCVSRLPDCLSPSDSCGFAFFWWAARVHQHAASLARLIAGVWMARRRASGSGQAELVSARAAPDHGRGHVCNGAALSIHSTSNHDRPIRWLTQSQPRLGGTGLAQQGRMTVCWL